MSNALLTNWQTRIPKQLYRGTVSPGNAPAVRVTGSSSASSSGVTTRSATVPAGVVANDVLLYFVQVASSVVGMTAPAGYTQVGLINAGAPVVCFAKVAVGTESGTTPAATWTTSQTAEAVVVVISGMDVTDALTAAITVSGTPNGGPISTLTYSSRSSVQATRPVNAGSQYLQVDASTANALLSVTTAPTAMGPLPLVGQTGMSLAIYQLLNGPGGQTITWSSTASLADLGLNLWGAAPAAIYTCPANTRAIVEEILLSNSGGAAMVDVMINGMPALYGNAVPSGGNTKVDLEDLLVAGDTLSLISSAGSSGITAVVSGTEVC